MNPQKSKLVFFLPKYEADSNEHLAHFEAFLARLSTQTDLWIVIDKCVGEPDFPHCRVSRLRLRLPYLKFFELFVIALHARFHGFYNFYVHYGYEAAFAFSRVRTLAGGCVFYWSCGMMKMFAPATDASLWAKVRYAIKSPLARVLRRVDYLVTGTPTMADYYVEHYQLAPRNALVCPNFVDSTRFHPLDRDEARRSLGLAPDRKIFLFLHRLAPRKGADQIIPLTRQLKAIMEEPFVVVVAGGGPYLSTLRAERAEYGLEDVVDIRGWVPNRDAPTYFSAADLFFMPSTEEGFPRVLIEAMACGCPFVGSDVGGVGDVVTAQQRRYLADPADRVDFAAKMAAVVHNSSLAQTLSRDGIDHAEKFSINAVCNAFVTMIEQRTSAPWVDFSESR